MSDREGRGEMRELRAEFRRVQEGVEFMEKAFEEMKRKFEEERLEREAIKKENESLRATCSKHESTIAQLQKRLDQCEQYSRRSNLDIKGVVQAVGEDVTAVVCKIGAVIGEPIVADDIEVCHRVPTRDADKTNVIVQFRSRQKRDSVLEKARKSRLRNSQIGINDESPIFVNEHLCPALKRLLFLAGVRKRDYHWRYLWTRNGKIFARKNEGTDLVRIQSESDLNKIV